jgi:hypothetical protein
LGGRRWIANKIVGFLTEPLPHYEQRVANDRIALARTIRKGDVLLVNGDNRVSAIIRYLTQSAWTHSALYIGDDLLRRGGPYAETARRAYGAGAKQLLLEALPEGVVVSPLSKYTHYNIRLVRPHRLRREHLDHIMNDAVAALGWRYDLRNVVDLARYLIPVQLVPTRFRRTALHFGSGVPTEVICSSLIAQLFQRVRFPILPTVEHPHGFDAAAAPRRGRFLRRVFGHESDEYTGIFRMRHPTLLTPADFDLSPYFEIVKFNVIASGRFDYQRIRWAEDQDVPSLDPWGEASNAPVTAALEARRAGG